jgi:hypothetical protein
VNRVVLGGLALLVSLAIGGAVWVAASRHPADSLDPAITSSLASQGITVSAPSTTSVPTTRDQAVTIALKDFPNPRPVSTAVLAKVRVQPNAAYDCTCWVVSWLLGTGVPPQGGPPGHKLSADQFRSWMRYHVTFVDAKSGKFEFALESYYALQPSPTPS